MEKKLKETEDELKKAKGKKVLRPVIGPSDAELEESVEVYYYLIDTPLMNFLFDNVSDMPNCSQKLVYLFCHVLHFVVQRKDKALNALCLKVKKLTEEYDQLKDTSERQVKALAEKDR